MSARLVERWLRAGAAAIHSHRDWLSELDAAIGDGDHGINLDRGFERIVAGLDRGELPRDDPGRLLAAAGRLVLGTVGGASGALYGRGFIRAGERLAALTASGPGGDSTPGEDKSTTMVAQAVDTAVEAIAALGRSRPGEKTMLDALDPAARSLSSSARAGAGLAVAIGAAAQAAAMGAEATIPLVATKGRASYLGERSVGHLDPGAASSALLLGALADAAAEAGPVEGRTAGPDLSRRVWRDACGRPASPSCRRPR